MVWLLNPRYSEVIQTDLRAEFAGSADGAQWFNAEDFARGMEKSPARILVVDDESLVRWSLLETLHACGFHVTEARDGASAISALSAAERPDLVLLDLRLPDCDDLHVLSAIHQLAPRVPIVLMTAYASRDVLDDALRVGASVVIGKPFDMEKIGPLVERALAARPS
jgi:DNA-binding NtrC family response regulator